MFASAYQLGALRRLEKHADAHAAELVTGALRAALAQAPLSSKCWQPELGAATTAIANARYTQAALHMLFGMQALGVPVACTVHVTDPLRVSIGGHLFDIAGTTTLAGGPRHLTVTSHEPASELVLRLVDGCWRCQQAEMLPATWRHVGPTFATGGGVHDIYLQAWEEPDDQREDIVAQWPLPFRHTDDSARVADAAATIGHAMDVLDSCGPRYVPWLSQLFRGVASTPLGYDDMRQSGSYLAHAGVFNCGFPGGAESLAEVIVHEVSHQNYLLLNSMYPLCDDQRDGLLYSSLKRKHRTLSRVLFAFHATANMAVFWRDLDKVCPLSAYYQREQKEIDHHAGALYRVVRDARGLTSHGQVFFDALVAEMRERDIELA